MDSSYSVEGAAAQLWSPTTSPVSSGCLQLDFYYYMFGSASNMELNVHAVTAGTIPQVFSRIFHTFSSEFQILILWYHIHTVILRISDTISSFQNTEWLPVVYYNNYIIISGIVK